MSPVSRRTLLLGAVAAGFASRSALASVAETDEMMGKLTGGAKAQAGKVTLKLPLIAENGNTVAFTVIVDSPMTEADHVKAIHVMAEDNPSPAVASFRLGPDNGKAEVSMRMRLAKTQKVRAVAVMSDGSVWQTAQEIKVTIGGCGG